MRPTLSGLALTAVFLAPVLTGCGSDEGADASEWGTGEVVGAAASEDPATPAAAPSSDTDTADTIAKSALTADQVSLHAEMSIFEDAARAEVGEGVGGSVGSFREPGEDSDQGMVRPDGITVAQEYTVSWADGKVTDCALISASGERMTFKAGRLRLEVEVDSLRHEALAQVVQELEAAVADWTAQHGEPPAVSNSSEGFTLSASLFDDADAERVVVPTGDSITLGDYLRVNDDLTVELRSDETQEIVRLTQDGSRFFRPVPIV